MVPLGESHTETLAKFTKQVDWHTLLQVELLYTSLIRSDGGALDTNSILLDSLGGIDGDLVVGLITVLETEIVVLEVNVEVWVNELVLSVLLCCGPQSDFHVK